MIGLIVKDPHVSGTIIIKSASGNTKEFQTRMCVHCGGHHTVIPGSGRKRGWCNHCKGFLCGKRSCFVCVPFREKIEFMEAQHFKDQATIKAILKKHPHIEKFLL